ncbi:hypothetical protein NQ317_004778 [Molorchus minor]|uniref:HTH CENPB-type domain-containing protein n=1 Tax=Molorchus minor TaxID=1323400 RepID=A0ABQ9JU43_9CUCU|nr:hypothetical protein NQ317_004778 [Molorchus minor]
MGYATALVLLDLLKAFNKRQQKVVLDNSSVLHCRHFWENEKGSHDGRNASSTKTLPVKGSEHGRDVVGTLNRPKTSPGRGKSRLTQCPLDIPFSRMLNTMGGNSKPDRPTVNSPKRLKTTLEEGIDPVNPDWRLNGSGKGSRGPGCLLRIIVIRRCVWIVASLSIPCFILDIYQCLSLFLFISSGLYRASLSHLQPFVKQTPTNMTSKRKKVTVTMNKKLEALGRIDKGESLRAIAKEFGVGASTVSDWKKNRKEIEDFCRKLISKNSLQTRGTTKKAKYESLDDELFLWFSDQRDRGVAISGRIIQKKALSLNRNLPNGDPSFTASSGWLNRWKARHGVRQQSVSGKPRALQHANFSSLPVVYKSQENAWMDNVILKEWFFHNFVPSVHSYLKKEGLPFKAILLIHKVPPYLIEKRTALRTSYMAASSWEQVSESTIVKSWENALSESTEELFDIDDEIHPSEFVEMFRNIVGFADVDIHDVRSWLQCDDDEDFQLTEDDIIAACSVKEETDDNIDIIEPKLEYVGHSEVTMMLDNVLIYLEAQPDTAPTELLMVKHLRDRAAGKRHPT